MFVTAVVPAAGRSRRMGTRKALADFGGEPMIRRVVERLDAAGVDEIVVVAGHLAKEIAGALAGIDATLVHNLDGEMLSSVQAGVRAASPLAEAYLVALGDQPAVRVSTIERLIESADARRIVRPVCDGHRGHPVMLPEGLREELLALPSHATLNDLLARHAREILEIDVGDGGVVRDLDVPVDYAPMVALWERSHENRR